MRPAITSVGPLLPQIGKDMKLSESAQGILSSLPLVAFALVSPLVPRFSKRLGTERAVVLALIFLSIGTLIRSYGGPSGLWLGTIIIGSAITFGDVLIPTIIRRDYKGNISLATSIYAGCIGGGAALASGVAVPLGNLLGWQGALAFWALPVALVGALWIFRLANQNPITDEIIEPEQISETPVWKQSGAWMLTIMMATQCTLFFTLVNWLPTVEISRGTAPVETGIHLFIFQIFGIASGFLVPMLMRNRNNYVLATVVSSITFLIGIIGIQFLPNLMMLWIVIAGSGCGMTLTAVLSLISIRGRAHHETTRLSGMVQSIGYLFAATGPLIFGFLGEHTNSWNASLAFVSIVAILQVIIAIPAGKKELV
ncbi:MAG: MFS transporter [Micrococcaceae bacterium]